MRAHARHLHHAAKRPAQPRRRRRRRRRRRPRPDSSPAPAQASGDGAAHRGSTSAPLILKYCRSLQLTEHPLGKRRVCWLSDRYKS